MRQRIIDLVEKMFIPKIINSYHHTTVIIDGKEINLGNSNYGLELQCSRVAGWQLWYKAPLIEKSKWELIGGEFNNNHFQIKFGNKLVFDNQKPKRETRNIEKNKK